MSRRFRIALAGQPNCGKSTIFNMLTGAKQHVANYPGVTVEKKTGFFSLGSAKAELVDLPGTYSLTSYSLEERVARDYILHSGSDAVINVIDAANLKRGLYLTLQILEMEAPLIVNLNMMDVAKRRSIAIDVEGLSRRLGVSVVPTVGKKSESVAALRDALASLGGQDGQNARPPAKAFHVDYGPLEPLIDALANAVPAAQDGHPPARWLAIKLLESDESAENAVKKHLENADELLARVMRMKAEFKSRTGHSPKKHIAYSRHRAAAELAKQYVTLPGDKGATLTDRIDSFVCHRFLGPVILVAILLALYQISIVWGNDLAAQAWPFWESCMNFLTGFLPDAGYLEDPLLRSLGIWSMKSVAAILNYLPIFFLLFALVAILEDSGYMPRMAFILDKIFRRYGLHGQSTLPLILGGVYVGGCAIPAVMATKAIPDEKARLATILITPMMNCLAKVPLYLILITAYFTENSGLAMFFIATVTLLMALPVAKALSLTLLRGKESAPFIMEMPPYHMPTFRGVFSRTIERIWVFIKKIVTVVLAVAIIIFALITFPGLDAERAAHYSDGAETALDAFLADAEKTAYAGRLVKDDLQAIVQFDDDLKTAKQGLSDQAAATAVDERFQAANPVYFDIVRGQSADGKELRKSLRKLVNARKTLRREMREETFENSFLGLCGKALEPVTRYAGFNWKINIALLSAFAAKENSAATLGAIYGLDGDEGSVQENMRAGALEFGPLHALALMLFMALYPPCVPTSVMVRLQSNSTGWMLFSILYQTLLGLGVATLVFSGASALGLTGWQAMWAFYGLCLAATVIMGLLPERKNVSWSGTPEPSRV